MAHAVKRYALLALLFVSGCIGQATAATYFATATPQFGELAYTSVTHTTAATADTVITISGPRRVLIVTNSLDKEVYLTWAATKKFYLPASTSMTIDLGTNTLQANDAVVIGVYHLGVAPTVGRIAASAL